MGTKIASDLISESHYNPEQKLWRHVILNAIEDAQLLNVDRKNSMNKMNAHNWIMYDEDFNKICWWAGWDPDDVRFQYKKAISQRSVKFYKKHILWMQYTKYYNNLKIEKDLERRRALRKTVLAARKAVFNATSIMVTSLICLRQVQ
tara:strand:- start:83 stop:523 length:441 start_codon:yes stop_codon:yes gene_type:complete